MAFPPDVEAAAGTAAAHPRLPDLDRTDLEFLTIDPPGSRDLDQAMHIARDDDGYVVSYAIADVGAFVSPGDPVDREAMNRGQTFYGPDRRIPLHPTVLSEGAASLLPEEMRPALLWTMRLNAAGDGISSDVVRARVRSRAALDYAGVQRDLDAGRAGEVLVLLAEVGKLREQREIDRGGVHLPVPEQEVIADDGRLRLAFRGALPVEGWNAQISLMTGIAAAQLMLYAQVGVLRTLPPADRDALARLHRTAAGMGVSWPAETTYPQFVHALDPNDPRHRVVAQAATSVLRGASYVAFDGAVPEQPLHAALASEYAHVTAPLRRLVDRYVGEVCVRLCAGQPVPTEVRSRLGDVAARMVATDRTASAYDHACVALVEAAVMASRIGERFDGVIVDIREPRPESERPGTEQPATQAAGPRTGTVQLVDPAVTGTVEGAELPLGEALHVTCTVADVERRTVRFSCP